MHCRIDPSSPLTEQDAPSTRCDCVRNGIRSEFHLESREMLHHERGEVSIFSEREQVLLMECVDVRLGVLIDDQRGDDDRSTFVRRSDTVDGETSR